MEDMKLRIAIFIFMMLFLNTYASSAAENEYGIVKAWFNGQNATAENIKLKIGEPADIKVMVISKINGHVFVEITEPGITKAFDILSGPTKQDESIDNYDITSGWSQTYTWTIAPNGAWKNGNAPINVFVQFFNMKTKDNKMIEFTIANPYILNEQYPGSGFKPVQTTEIIPGATAPKEMPFVPAIAALAVMLAIWWWRRG